MLRRLLEKAQASSSVEEKYCLIRWSDNDGFDIVPQEQLKVPVGSVTVYETYAIDMNGRRRKGTVILIGTKQDCERLHYNITKPRSTYRAEPRQDGTIIQTNERYVTATSASNIVADVKQESKNDGSDDKDERAIRNVALMKLLQLVIAGTTADNNGEAHRVRCGACGSSPIRSDRYKCLICEQLSLCARCFEHQREVASHKSGHAFVHFKSPDELFGRTVSDRDVTMSKLQEFYANDVHESTSCDGCNRERIEGLRFKCDACPNYDLCQECLENGITTGTHKSDHPLVVIPRQAIQQIPVDDIELGDELGKGAFGCVCKAKWLSKQRTVACKVITVPRTSEAQRLEKSFSKEVAAYAELSGAYILKTYGFTASRFGQGKRYMIIMEYMSHGSLATLIEKEGDRISLRRRLDMAMNIASGMRKIHEHRMIHRDIRSDNILVNDNYVAKIGDMGIARVVDPLNQHTQIGCQPYMPPEFYRGTYDQKLDIFTFGLTLNELFTSTKHSFQPLVGNKIAFLKQSPIFADLISRCTADDPKRRPAAIEIEKTLELYSLGFNETVLKKHPRYMVASTEAKNKIFIEFFEKFHPPATEFIRKKFPPEFLDNPQDVPGVKVDEKANDGIRIECPVQ